MLAKHVKPQTKRFARAMRRRPTKTEELLLKALRKAAKGKYTVFSQRIVLGFIVDIYLPAAKVAVEVDGSAHDGRERYDESRDAILRDRAGVITLRFHNETVTGNVSRVVNSIIRLCESLPKK